jgi:hypothetical protein
MLMYHLTMRDLLNRTIIANMDVHSVWLVVHCHHVAFLDDSML